MKTKFKKTNRIFSLVLSVAMVLCMVPMTSLPAHAAPESPCTGDHTGWNELSSKVITSPGKYYLVSNFTSTTIDHTLQIECSGEVTLCLNGHTLSYRGSDSTRNVILSLKYLNTLNLCDCVGTGIIETNGNSGGVSFLGGTFNMYGGTIRNCYESNSYGSAIYLDPNTTFNMYGGKITGNSNGNDDGGAVGSYFETSKINLYGGSITGNGKYGVYSCSGPVYVSGDVKITGNTSGDVYLPKGLTLTVGTLTEGADIGVTSASGENDIAITGTNAADYSKYFHADNSSYQILNKDNVVYLHKHNYSAATCVAPKTCFCGLTEGSKDSTNHNISTEWKSADKKHYKECLNGCGAKFEEDNHSFSDSKCSVCSYICPHTSYTDGICDNCDYECAHTWGEGVLTRPTFETAGYYTYTCTLCGHSYTEPTKRADDTALNDASMKVMEYIGNDTLTQEAANEIHNSYLDILKNNGNIFDEFGFVRNDLVEEDQPLIDAVTEALQKIIDDADEKIASGEYVKADYTVIDNDIYELEYKLGNKMITDEGKSGFEEIKKQLNEMKADENTSKADLAELEKALSEYEAEIDKGIEDGTLVKFDGEKVFSDYESEVGEALIEKYGADFFHNFINKVLGEKFYTEYDKIYSDACALKGGTMAENAENIEHIKEMVYGLYGKVENCIEGDHLYEYVITTPGKCNANAFETGFCPFCGATTDEREVENSMTDHTDEDGDKLCDGCGSDIEHCELCGGNIHKNWLISIICIITAFANYLVLLLGAI